MLTHHLLTAWLPVLSQVCAQPLGCRAFTSSGVVRGTCDGTGQKYLGIPYAQAPVGDLRFEKPQPLRQLGTRHIDGSKRPKMCPQPHPDSYNGAEVDEDCLFANVYTPPQTSGKELLPVMVWVHGGSFKAGSATEPQLDGSKLANGQNIIVVSVSYRLGALGWLNGKNQGMEDVIEALRWIRRNIKSFGGDASQVTIAGQSSGSTVIRYMLNAQDASTLFKRAILQSDPMGYPAFNQSTVEAVNKNFAKNLGCDASDMDCFKHANVEDILKAQDKVTNTQVTNYSWGPSIDGDLVTKDTYDALQSGGLANDVDILVGNVAQEAGPAMGEVAELSEQKLTQMFKAKYPSLSQLYKVWRSNVETNNSAGQAAIDLGTNYLFECPQRMISKAIAEKTNAKVFTYKFTTGIHNPHNDKYKYCDPSNPSIVCHEDDILAVFGTFADDKANGGQRGLSKQVQQHWGNFIKHGDPSTNSPQWHPIGDDLNIMLLGQNTVSQTDDSKQCEALEDNTKFLFTT